MPPKPLPSKASPSRTDSAAIRLFDDQSIQFALAMTRKDVCANDDVWRVFATFYPDWHKKQLSAYPAQLRLDDWEIGQRLLRRILPDVSKFGDLARDRRRMLTWAVNDHLLSHDSDKCIFIGDTGLELRGNIYSGDSVLGICVRSMVRFMIPARYGGWSPTRIGKCQYRKCREWFLRPLPRRGSVPLYCSKAHANSARVMEFRIRHQKKDD
jgi:hypothetical protein